MHEIVTIQLGTQSNYVATHFWNAQESYFTYPPDPPSLIDHNVHFRPGITRNGTETFTPRALVYDFKESFGALGASGGLYDETADDEKRDGGIWSQGPITTIRQPLIPPSTYHESLASGTSLARPLTISSIQSFTDYLTPFYHPRSLHPVSVLTLSQSTLPPPVSSYSTASPQRPSQSSSFQTWQAGEELFLTLNNDHELLDSDLRFWLEECDAPQGVQLLFDATSAWGGFAKGWLDGIRDELGSKASVWAWAVDGWDEDGGPEVREKRRAARLLNGALALFALAPLVSLYLPLASAPASLPPYVALEKSSPWHTAALQMAALETATLPSRLRTTTMEGSRGLLRDVEEAVNRGGEKKVVGVGLSIECLSETDGEIAVDDHRVDGSGDHQMTDFGNDGGELQTVDIDMFPLLGGLSNDGPRQHVFGRVDVLRGVKDLAHGDKEDENARRRYGGPIVESYETSQPLPLLETYPRIFTTQRPQQKSLRLHTALQTTSTIAARIRDLEVSARKFASLEEREALSNGLKGIADEYVEGWESGSDEGDDEDW